MCTFQSNSGKLGLFGVFRWLDTLGNRAFSKEGQGFCLVGLACSWVILVLWSNLLDGPFSMVKYTDGSATRPNGPFSMGKYHQFGPTDHRTRMTLHYKRGDGTLANSCLQVASSETCSHCISHLFTLLGEAQVRRENQGFTLGKNIESLVKEADSLLLEAEEENFQTFQA